ncbi:MAG: hypothetical protein ACRDYE_04795 [Acidimicrobiales bacterium]
MVPAAFLDDASMHEQMVRFATRSIQLGHDPLTSWFPYLGEGSPQFLHYQGLGAMVTGLAGAVVGPDTAFRWSLLILVACWPIVIFASARLIGLPGWTASASAVLSPLIVSVPSVGYEHGAYLWIGYGLWAQLWASWTLPLAWAFTWRAMDESNFLLPAALCIALTAGFHFETGYLAFLAVLVFPLMVPSQLRVRLRRAVLLLAGGLLASAWAWVPVIYFGRWASINEPLQGTPLVNGYGAGRVLSWLVTGQVYDAGRFPILTLLVVVGLVFCVMRWRHDPLGRALVVLWSLCLVLTFGRTTFGNIVTVIPGSQDIFFRRFLMGSQLAGLLLAGLGTARSVDLLRAGTSRLADRMYDTDRDRKVGRRVLLGIAALVAAIAVSPALVQITRFDSRNAAATHWQNREEGREGSDIAPLIAFVRDRGGGRTYAGLPTNWGNGFTVGDVPVFKYLENADVDEVGYTLRTASLMTDPEYYFDERNRSDYTLFGIRYLILPSSMDPPVVARSVMRDGPYKLWSIGSNGYLDVVEPVGVISADRSNIATRTLSVLRSSLIADHEDQRIEFAGSSTRDGGPDQTTDGARPSGTPGVVLAGPKTLNTGLAAGEVRLTRPGAVLLSASFDPGWQVTVDGRRRAAQMFAPAVVGVAVGPGVHRVLFTYIGFSYYPELFAIGTASLVVLFVNRQKWRRRERSGPPPT